MYFGHQDIITRFIAVTLILALLFQVSACHNYRQIPLKVDPETGERDPEDLDQTLKNFSGKKVKVVLRDGRSVTGRIADYQGKQLKIKMDDHWTESVDKADITAIQEQKLNIPLVVGGGVLSIGAAIGFVALLLYIIVGDSLDT